MHSFTKRNKKKLLAIFGVLLMVAFVIPTTGFLGHSNSVTLGKAGNATVTSAMVEQAAHELPVVGRVGMLSRSPDLRTMFLSFIAGPKDQFPLSLDSNPLSYVLLQKEAEQAGISPPGDIVLALAQDLQEMSGPMKVQLADPEGAARRALSVVGLLERQLGRVKTTVPQVLYGPGGVVDQQAPTLNLVEFKSDDYLKNVPTPPESAIQTTYERFASVPPRSASSFAATQPARLGYLRPDRVMLQYLTLSKARLIDAAMTELTPDDLYLLNRIASPYYAANANQFKLPYADFKHGPFTQPVLRPFAEALPDLRRRLITADIAPPPGTPSELTSGLTVLKTKVDKRVEALRTKVADRLQADYAKHAKGETVTLATTQPAGASPAGASPAAFTSPEYLESVLVAVTAEAGAPLPPTGGWLPTLVLSPLRFDLNAMTGALRYAAVVDEWHTKDELNQIDGLNLSFAGVEAFNNLATRSRPADAPGSSTQPAATQENAATTQPAETQPAATSPAATQTASTQAASTQPATRPANVSVMALYEPSPLLMNASTGDAYIFRLTAFEGERVPPLDEIREQIIKDLKTNEAFLLAHKAAQTLLDAGKAATGGPDGALPGTAALAGEKVITTGPVQGRGMFIDGYPTDPASSDALRGAAQLLVRKATTSEPHPTMVVDLASTGKALAVELRGVERAWPASQDFFQQRLIAEQSMQFPMTIVLADFLNPETIAKRAGYKPRGGE